MIWERHTLLYLLNKETELLTQKSDQKYIIKIVLEIQGVRIYSIIISGFFFKIMSERGPIFFNFCGVFCWLPYAILKKTILKTLTLIRTSFVSSNKYVLHLTGVESDDVHRSTTPIKVFRAFIENTSVEVEISYNKLIKCSSPSLMFGYLCVFAPLTRAWV